MLDKARGFGLEMLHKSPKIIVNVFQNVSQEEATTYRDTGDGWTALEALCHLRDFDDIFHSRAVMMLEQDNPHFPAVDHDALVVERNYNRQDLREVIEAYVAFRQTIIQLFEGLTEDQWMRAGVHPARGDFSVSAQLMQFPSHDMTHIEQITRTLAEKRLK